MQKMMKAVYVNMQRMLEHALNEKKMFIETSDVVYLQQAGEKLFNALENYVQYIFEIQVFSFYEIQQLAKNDKDLLKLLRDAKELHRFFYRGELEMSATVALDIFDEVYEKVHKLVSTTIPAW